MALRFVTVGAEVSTARLCSVETEPVFHLRHTISLNRDGIFTIMAAYSSECSSVCCFQNIFFSKISLKLRQKDKNVDLQTLVTETRRAADEAAEACVPALRPMNFHHNAWCKFCKKNAGLLQLLRKELVLNRPA